MKSFALPGVVVLFMCASAACQRGSGGHSADSVPTQSPQTVQSSSPSSASQGDAVTWDWQLPAHCPPPPVPDDTPMTAALVALGRHLFYDPRLSGDGTQSCATCHIQQVAFSDPRPLSLGITGERTRRNAMSLVNVAYARRLTWAHPALDSLERQALIPLFGDEPIEMGAAGFEQLVLDRLAAEPRYRELAIAAGPGQGTDLQGVLDWNLIVTAIATFERSLVSCNAPYDRYIAGDTHALSADAVAGMELFFSERTECFHCHNGAMFSDSTTHEGAVPTDQAFHNTGLYNLDGSGAYPPTDTGMMEFSENATDMGRFRAPTLRNITLTAPYMHDGSIGSLEEVLEHYGAGGRLIAEGPNAGDGAGSPLKSEFVPGFLLTDEESAQLLAFLAALTDTSVSERAEWSDPWTERTLR